MQLLAEELRRRGRSIVATTTTAMFARELEAVGSLVLESGLAALRTGVEGAIGQLGSLALARENRGDGKVGGLPPEWIDDLWATSHADYFLVEADGSRGKSLKLFGQHEPRVPSLATTIVQVAGLDALGAPLTDFNAHRSGRVAQFLGCELGATVTADMFSRILDEQSRVLQSRWPNARVVMYLNKADDLHKTDDLSKADDRHLRRAGPTPAIGLLVESQGRANNPGPAAIVVGSLRNRSFLRVDAHCLSHSACRG